MKFWKNLKQLGNSSQRDREEQQKRRCSAPQRLVNTPNLSRRRNHEFNSLHNEDSIYEDFRNSPSPSLKGSVSCSFGSTFVELIKRKGSKLGVVVQGGLADQGIEPYISDLVCGSWAQRSDVLAVGDTVVSINNIPTLTLSQKEINKLLEQTDRVQLEVRYPLPQRPPSRKLFRSKIIQVTLHKENGSFGMIIRGGNHEFVRRKRPFTIMHITPNGPAFKDATIRVNDRIRAINGHDLENMKLPELQSLIYQQDKETVFTIEYDIATHDRLDHGPVLVEIRRDINDIMGFGLNKCHESGHIFVESIRQASLADRCGAVGVGDIVLSANAQDVSKFSINETYKLITGDPNSPHIAQLEILPGLFSRTLANPFRSSMPSPCFSSLRGQKNRNHCQRYNSLTEIDRDRPHSMRQSPRPPPLPLSPKERRKYVTFTVELQRDGGPLGLTLATEEAADRPGPIFISALLQEGLAERSKTIQINDQLVEINGTEVRNKCLNDVIHLLQECSSEVIRLKLARLMSIPERDFSHSRKENNSNDSDYSIYSKKPPLPSPNPVRLSSHNSSSKNSSRRESLSSVSTSLTIDKINRSPTPSNTVSLLPIASLSRNSSSNNIRPVPMEVHKVILFKDKLYEDFGFSVSDGLYEKGIFINSIRKGGPADSCGILRPLDRIIQINDTRTSDFDCCLAVPLIAAAGDKIELLVARTTKISCQTRKESEDEICDYEEYKIRQKALEYHPEIIDYSTLSRRRSTEKTFHKLSRTSSADGRLGSITNHVVPWTSNGN